MADELGKLRFADLLWFMLKTKFRIAFLSDKTPIKNILRFLGFLFTVLTGVLYGDLFNVILAKSQVPDIESKANVVIILMGLFFIIIRNYYPTFSPPSNLISRIYPVRNFHKTIINIGSDLITSVTIFLTGFFIPFTIMARHYSAMNLLFLAIIVISVIFVDRSFRLMMVYTMKNKIYLVSTIIVSIGLIAFLTQLYWFFSQNSTLIWGIAILLLIISFVNSLWVDKSLDGTSKGHTVRSVHIEAISIQTVFRSIYLRDKKFRRFVLSLLFKIFLLYELSLVQTQQTPLSLAFFAALLMSPTVIFSYISNNFFGHFKELWLGNRIYSHDSKFMLNLYLQSLVLPLSIDFIMTIILLGVAIYLGFLTPIWILCYFAQLILFAYCGFLISILKPIKITESMGSSFKRTTSQLYSSLMLVLVLLIGGVMYMHWYWALLIVIPIAAVLHVKLLTFYESKFYDIYSILY